MKKVLLSLGLSTAVAFGLVDAQQSGGMTSGGAMSGGMMSGEAMSGGMMSGGAMSGGAMSGGSMSTNTVIDVLSSRPELNTLLSAIDAAGLREELTSGGPFTLFAPTNDAFAALPEGELESLLADPQALASVLQNHVVSGSYTLTELEALPETLTLSGNQVSVTDSGGTFVVGDANVLNADLTASNGYINVVDTVITAE